jgi:hypothetical protein
MYYYYNCNSFSKEYLPFKKYRCCIENILKMNIEFKNLNELKEEDVLIIFSYDIFNPSDIFNELVNYKFKILLINTESFRFPRIIELFQQINNNKNICLIEYNIINIHYIQANFKNIIYYFIPLLYNPCLETMYNQKYILFNERKNDILFCGSPACPRRMNLLNTLSSKFNTKVVNHLVNGIEHNLELANSKIILNIYYYPDNKIFDYYRNSYLLANKCLLISEYPENIDLTIEKNLIGYEENLIFFKYDDCERVLEKYLKLDEEEYNRLVNKQYEWFKSQNNMIDYASVAFN